MDLGRAIAGFPQKSLVGAPSTQGRAKIGANKFDEAMNELYLQQCHDTLHDTIQQNASCLARGLRSLYS